MTSCSIIPPYLLDVLSRSADAEVAARARSTLAIDEELRRGAQGGFVQAEPRSTYPEASARGSEAGPQRAIHDANNGTELPGELVRSEGEEADADGDAAVTEAYDGLGATWELWMQAYGRNSLDDAGLPLIATVHYGVDYDNAFWDGSQMVFGDGDGTIFLRFTRSLDVIGHELAHGVTQHTSGLNYQGQSGALNESVSDVFGVLVKQRLLDQTADEADWLIGADLLAPGINGTALRSMAQPGTAYDDPQLGKDPQPGHMSDYVDTSEDNGGVHINSGIPNRAFYLAATQIGGNAWEDAGQIWVDVILGDIKADCDFLEFADLCTHAAAARFGDDSAQHRAVQAAWDGVGVTGADVPQLDPRTRTAPAAPAADQTHVVVRRTGGFAGTVRERGVQLAELPVPDAQQWQSLLSGSGSGLRELADSDRASAASYADAFNYGVRCERPAVDLSIPGPALPDSTLSLFERTLRDSGPGTIAASAPGDLDEDS